MDIAVCERGFSLGIARKLKQRIQNFNLLEFNQFIPKSDPNILEIGANDGLTTEKFVRIFPGAKIFCFEPDGRAIEQFERKGFGNQVELFTCAVCDVDGTIDFFASDGTPDMIPDNIDISKGWHCSGSIKEPTGHLEIHKWCKFEAISSVPATRLDTWASEALESDSHIDLIWMDVQGAEAEVFKGAKNTLNRVNYIFTEYSDRELYKGQPNLESISELLSDFRLVDVFGGDALFQNLSLSKKTRSISRLLLPREYSHH